MQPNPGRMFRMLGLVSKRSIRLPKKREQIRELYYGRLYRENRVHAFQRRLPAVISLFTTGSLCLLTGFFKQRYNQGEFEFKVQQVSLAETLKKTMTKQVNVHVHPQHVNKEMIHFVEKNLLNFPGQATLRFIVTEPKKDMRISLVTTGRGFEMNEEMIQFLEEKPGTGSFLHSFQTLYRKLQG